MADALRADLDHTCMSPPIANLRSEMYIKSINAFAFNLVALDREFNNRQLLESKSSITAVKTIMAEGDGILRKLNLPIVQNITSRIEQTLSSTEHTMSMLTAYRKDRQIELPQIWDSFLKVAGVVGVDLTYTKQCYARVIKRLSC